MPILCNSSIADFEFSFILSIKVIIPLISPSTAITIVVFASETKASKLDKTSSFKSMPSVSISLRFPASTVFISPSTFTLAFNPLPVMFSKSSTSSNGRSSFPSFAN